MKAGSKDAEMDGEEEPAGVDGAMITSLCWVSRGYAKAIIDEDENMDEHVAEHAKMVHKLAKGTDAMKKDIGQAAKELEKNLDKMSLEDDSDDDVPIFTAELAKMKAEARGEKYVEDEVMDGSDEEHKDNYPDGFSDSEEEKEDFTIKKTDSIIVAATADNDHSNLEVYIYEHEKSNLYVHHEIILSAYPLCIEWLPKFQNEKSNLIVVGTFLPLIEIWNLDSENCEPIATLGQLPGGGKLKKSSKKTLKVANPEESETHTDAVMSISLNPHQ